MKIFSTGIEAITAFHWEGLTEKPIEEAALAVKQALRDLEGAEERIFHARMRVLRMARQLELYKLDTDPEVDAPFATLKRWIRHYWPKSYRYCQDALEAEETLAAVPMERLAKITCANLKVLADEGLSSGLRSDPDVLAAAEGMTKEQFIGHLSETYHQHLQPPRLMPKETVDEFEAAIEMAMICEECKSRSEAIRCISISYIQEKAVEFEHKRQSA